MKPRLYLALALASAGPTALAPAQVIPLPAFDGAFDEGFETQTTAGMSGWQTCIIGDAFSGTTQVCTPSGDHMHVTTSWSYGCQAAPHGDDYLAGSRTGSYVLFSFSIPIDRFGGYFCTNAPEQGAVAVYLYDQSYNLLGLEPLDLDGCNWRWNGWETQGPPIAFIEVVNSLYGGGRVLFDDLTLDFPDGTIGTRYCNAAANSTGQAAAIEAVGSTSLAADDLGLRALPVPSGTPGIFFYGGTQAQAPFSAGLRCVGDDGRGIRRLGLTQASAAGILALDFDYTAPPNQALTVTAGSTWFFQSWFLDPGFASGAGLSDAVELVFAP